MDKELAMQPRATSQPNAAWGNAVAPTRLSAHRARATSVARARAAYRSSDPSRWFDDAEAVALDVTLGGFGGLGDMDLVESELRADNGSDAGSPSRGWVARAPLSARVAQRAQASREAASDLVAAILANRVDEALHLAYVGARLDVVDDASEWGLSALEATEVAARPEDWLLALVAARVAGAERREALLAEAVEAVLAEEKPAEDRPDGRRRRARADEALLERAALCADAQFDAEMRSAAVRHDAQTSTRAVAVESARLLCAALASKSNVAAKLAAAVSMGAAFGELWAAQTRVDALPGLDRALRHSATCGHEALVERLLAWGARSQQADGVGDGRDRGETAEAAQGMAQAVAPDAALGSFA
ncbi:hypothetical protein LA345_13360 [Burkholderia vietnamiensis]|uniref:Uncharacterized protein n=1 Tax=Burkholderia vietnamiensis (strain G4 / LMG 22486) TaxID=269482 RepID=A4JFU3_BURVG|nr:hypothetical protein Bcep1808_2144 [Burkholderia vietnamiensis G4]MCB4344902.1 hypothetical protein [Burkholderia vietnamiensis]